MSGDVMVLPYLVISGEVRGLYFERSGGETVPNLDRSMGLRAVGQNSGDVLRRLLH